MRQATLTAISTVAVGALLTMGASAQTTTAGGSTSVNAGATRQIDFKLATVGAGFGSTFLFGNTHTGGVAWVDYNGDLLSDLFITNGTTRDHYLFRNNGDGTFTDVTASALIGKPDLTLEDSGAKYADVDNDGDDDILVPVDNPTMVVPGQPVNPPDGGPNLFYRNQGNGTFVEEAMADGIVHPLGRRTISSGFADYDRDGFVDLYLGSWTPYGLPLGVNDDYDRLLHNDGTGAFTDVTATFGTDGHGLDALTMLWMDPDGDRYPDIYVGVTAPSDSPPIFIITDVYYRNSAGTAFTDDIPNQPGIGNDGWAPMGMDIADIDNDGDWDFYYTDNFATPPVPQGNVFYLGDGKGNWTDNTCDLAGIQATDSWPCSFADLDLDGWVDLWVGTTSGTVPDYIYRNKHDGTFETVTGTGVSANVCKGGAFADADGDGDLDLAIWGQGQTLRYFRNTSIRSGSYLEVKLYGTDSNHGAIGAVVKITTNGMTQMRRVSGGNSAHSQSEAILHFGVGHAQTCDMTVEWPSGKDQTFTGIATGDLVLVDEDTGIISQGVTSSGSGWDPNGGVFEIDVKSNYGGRTHLAIEGLGKLLFDPETGTHRGRFTGLAHPPQSVTVTAERGGRWVLPVHATRRG